MFQETHDIVLHTSQLRFKPLESCISKRVSAPVPARKRVHFKGSSNTLTNVAQESVFADVFVRSSYQILIVVMFKHIEESNYPETGLFNFGIIAIDVQGFIFKIEFNVFEMLRSYNYHSLVKTLIFRVE